MKPINKKIMTVLLAGFTVLAISGCESKVGGVTDDGGEFIPPPDTNETVPLKDMTEEQAKDAMALNALFYPILIPLQGCLADPLGCILPGVAGGQAANAPMTPGDHECTVGDPSKGKYTVSDNADVLEVTFDTDGANPKCFDVANAQDIQGALMEACVGKIIQSPTTTAVNGSTYEVQYEGKVTCTKATSVVFDNYIVSAFGQTDPTNNPNRNSYNMTVSMSNGLGINGTYQNEKWSPAGVVTDPKVNDELWTFTGLNLSSPDTAQGFTVLADGGASYDGKIRLGDTTNPSLVLGIDFSNLSYAVTGDTLNSDVTITGGVKASCQPELVTYGTTATMNDLRDIPDADGNRMPSKGSMSMSIPGYNAAPALFEAPGTAQVTITASEGTTVYDSWRAITTTSSCAELQTIIDRVVPPPSPVVPGDIILENIVFATDTALTNNNTSATGKTDGHAVWYYLGRGQGYVEGQTVAETNFEWSATEPASAGAGTAHVNVYLYDENGDKQKATFPKLTSNPNEYADWSALVAAHPNWTIRTDYFESNFSPFTFFQGNFILRLGDSKYTATDEAFSIDQYVVNKK